ncbi:MAG: FeoA family protein [Anaerolineae bacterium]
MSSQAVTLANLEQGREGAVVSLRGGHGFVSRLAALGFTPGATVLVIRNSLRGPIIVGVMDTRIALGRNQAEGVLVRPLQ